MFDFEDKITAPVIENPEIVLPIKTTLQLDTQKTPLSSIITMVSGSQWVVEYYRQYLTPDMQPAPLDLERDPVNQQYLKIRNLELKVESALSPQQDDKTKEFAMVGTATVFPGMIPIKGDMIIANTGDGAMTLFTVTRTIRLTNTLDSLYDIEYRAIRTLDQLSVDNLTAKTSKETVFNKDFISVGKNPLLSLAESATYTDALETLQQVTRFYFDTFYDNQFECFTVPSLDCQTAIDPFLNEFILKIIAKRDFPQYNKVHLHNKHSIVDPSIRTVLDYLLHENTNVGIASFVSTEWLPSYIGHRFHLHSRGIETSGMDYMINVTKTDRALVNELKFKSVLVEEVQLVLGTELTPLNFTQQQYSASLALYYPTLGTRYIFSEYFYANDYSQMSVVEKMVHNAINKKEIEPNSVMMLLDALMSQAKPIEQYYLIPICFRLLERSLSEIA